MKKQINNIVEIITINSILKGLRFYHLRNKLSSIHKRIVR